MLDPRERRKHWRVAVPDAYALCRNVGGARSTEVDLASGWLGAGGVPHPHLFRVRNLSMGGALLTGPWADQLGAELEVKLFLPGRGFVMMPGTVRRSRMRDQGPGDLAVQFAWVAPDDEEALADTVADMICRERSPIALVGASRRHEARALGHSLREAGFIPLHVKTPLDAIHCLEDPGLSIAAVVLSSHLADMQAVEFAGYLAFSYPNIRRVLVARRPWRAMQASRGLVHAVIPRPWTVEQLASAMRTVN